MFRYTTPVLNDIFLHWSIISLSALIIAIVLALPWRTRGKEQKLSAVMPVSCVTITDFEDFTPPIMRQTIDEGLKEIVLPESLPLPSIPSVSELYTPIPNQ